MSVCAHMHGWLQFLTFYSIHFHTSILALAYVLKCQATLYFGIVVGTKSSPWQKTMSWSSLLANVFVSNFNSKQFYGIYPNTWCCANMQERCLQILLVVMPVLCAFLCCCQEEEDKIKEHSYSVVKWQVEWRRVPPGGSWDLPLFPS